MVVVSKGLRRKKKKGKKSKVQTKPGTAVTVIDERVTSKGG